MKTFYYGYTQFEWKVNNMICNILLDDIIYTNAIFKDTKRPWYSGGIERDPDIQEGFKGNLGSLSSNVKEVDVLVDVLLLLIVLIEVVVVKCSKWVVCSIIVRERDIVVVVKMIVVK